MLNNVIQITFKLPKSYVSETVFYVLNFKIL